jgi:hypothetical protein
MLTFSLRDDPMMAQLIMKNIVFLTSILILTYGLHVPKPGAAPHSWQGRSRCSPSRPCRSSTFGTPR